MRKHPAQWESDLVPTGTRVRHPFRGDGVVVPPPGHTFARPRHVPVLFDSGETYWVVALSLAQIEEGS